MKIVYRTGTKDLVNFHIVEVLFHKFCFNLNEKLSGITPGCSVYRGSLNRCPVVYSTVESFFSFSVRSEVI